MEYEFKLSMCQSSDPNPRLVAILSRKKISNFSRSRITRQRPRKLRRKEKDSRNSSLPRRTFLGRVVRRGVVWMLPHRSDTSQGHLHPLTRPRLTCPSFLSLFLFYGVPSRSRSSSTVRGWFLPCGRLCRHFPGGACASLPIPTIVLLFATIRAPRTIPSLSYSSTTMQRPLSTRQIFLR